MIYKAYYQVITGYSVSDLNKNVNEYLTKNNLEYGAVEFKGFTHTLLGSIDTYAQVLVIKVLK